MGLAADHGCTNFQASGSINFINARGPVQSFAKTEHSSCVHFGLTFHGSQFTNGPGPIEFSGLKFSMTVDSYDNLTSRAYDGPSLFMEAGRLEIGHEEPSEVPEPASLGLLGLGIAALAAMRRSRAPAA